MLVDGVLWDKWEPHMAASIYGWMQGLQQDRLQSTAEFVKSMYKRPQTPEYLAKITAASLKTPTNTAVTLIFNMTGRDTWANAVLANGRLYVRSLDKMLALDVKK